MKTMLCLGVSLVGLLASVVTANAVDGNSARVTTSRALRVAAVNELGGNGPWYIFQEAFGASLSASLVEQGIKGMPVKMISASASHASDDLLSGECDAVLVLGERVPSDLRGSEFTSLRAVSQASTPVRVFYFVMRKDDVAMQASLSVAFEKATSSQSFQDTVKQASSVRVLANNADR